MSNQDAPTVHRVPAAIAAATESGSVVVVLRPLSDPDLVIEAVLTTAEAHELARALDGTAGYLTTSSAQLPAVTG